MSASADEQDVMAVITAEAAAFWNKDFDGLAACHVQAEYTRRMGWWQRGGITDRRGWTDIGSAFEDHFARDPAPNPSASAVHRDNVNIRIMGDMAWVTFDQHSIDAGEPLMDMPGISHETRILERHDGRWLIAYVGYLLEPGR
jgi:hypothetical protein